MNFEQGDEYTMPGGSAGLIAGARTVRDVAFDVFRQHGLTTLFANPGSTEIALLNGLPDDFRFVLALHEGSVVGAATGFAIARDLPALVVLHTAAGLGNAVGALATARVNRAPLVVIVGQQDRRHLAFDPFLAGRLEGLAGTYPVWTTQPVRAQDVPSMLARAWHEARDGRGPAIVVVPMDDWEQMAGDDLIAAPAVLHRSMAASAEGVDDLVALLGSATAPALVVGAGADHTETWEALVRLAERLDCAVWQESFGARAGFPQDHPCFRGHLPSERHRLRSVLQPYDVVVAVGAPVFRQYHFEPGRFVADGTRLAIVTDDFEEAHRSPVGIAVVGSPAEICNDLAARLPQRTRGVATAATLDRDRQTVGPPVDGGRLRPGHVFSALAERLDPDTIVVEETPSSRPELLAFLPARHPLGFLAAATGGLGFALPAAVGVRLAEPERPVVAVVGDGSSLYAIQALWTAAHYGVGVLFIVLSNGRYAVMDRLAEKQGAGKVPWPAFEEVDVHRLAEGFGCESIRLDEYQQLTHILDRVLAALRHAGRPLLLDIQVDCDPTFAP